MQYEFDVFISYKSGSREWLREVFLPPFVHFLKNKIGDGASIYVDWHDIKTGNIWELSLKNGLAKSKCLVSLMMPTYFESEWCKREFAVFENRSRRCGMMTTNNSNSLIVPVILDVGRPFPESVSHLQCVDYQQFYCPNISAFKKLGRYQKLQDQLKSLASTVAQTLKNAPPWHPDWELNEWLEVPIDHLKIENFAVQRCIM